MPPRYEMSLEASKKGKALVHRHPESSFNNSTQPNSSNGGRRGVACSTRNDRSTMGGKDVY